MYILEKGTCGFNDIIIHTRKVPSTISWHMARLKAANIVKVRKQYEFNYYENWNGQANTSRSTI